MLTLQQAGDLSRVHPTHRVTAAIGSSAGVVPAVLFKVLGVRNQIFVAQFTENSEYWKSSTGQPIPAWTQRKIHQSSQNKYFWLVALSNLFLHTALLYPILGVPNLPNTTLTPAGIYIKSSPERNTPPMVNTPDWS